jgi:hypothetical protein
LPLGQPELSTVETRNVAKVDTSRREAQKAGFP